MQSKFVVVGLLLAGCGAIAGDPEQNQPGDPDAGDLDAGSRPDRPNVDEPEPFDLNDSLRGTTTGTMIGGQITSTGWRVMDRHDRIYWAIPPLREGAIEFTVTGMSNGSGSNMALGDMEIFTMYDGGHGMTEPVAYFYNFRNNYYKVVVRVAGTTRPDSGEQELIWVNCAGGDPGYNSEGCPCSNGYGASPQGGLATWDGTGERFRVEWNDTGSRLFRNGTMVVEHGWDAERAYAPYDLHFSFGTARAGDIPESGLPVGAVFSDLVVDGTTGTAPVVCTP